MMESWRPLVCAAALSLMGIGVAGAQTVIVTNAPAQSTVEVVLNATTIGSVTVASAGADATLPVDLLAKTGKTETSVHAFVDSCTTTVRVLLVEGALPPAVQGACNRTQMTGV